LPEYTDMIYRKPRTCLACMCNPCECPPRPDDEERTRLAPTCDCGALISAVTWTCVLGTFCPLVKNSAEQAAHRYLLSAPPFDADEETA
jgi:hypothetical protein